MHNGVVTLVFLAGNNQDSTLCSSRPSHVTHDYFYWASNQAQNLPYSGIVSVPRPTIMLLCDDDIPVTIMTIQPSLFSTMTVNAAIRSKHY